MNKKQTQLTLLLSFMIPAMLFCALLAVKHITPFGNNTFLYDDMKRQYIEFYSYYSTIINGKNDFFYSFSAGLGDDMLGFTAYYLTSPFLILLVLVPKLLLPAAISIIMGIKVSLCGLSACACFLDVREEMDGSGQHPAIIAVFSTAYAFCQFIDLNMANIMWLDALICFPLLLMLVRRMLSGRKKSGMIYVLLLLISLICNYYITYMILIFLFIYVLLFSKSIRKTASFIMSSLMGALLSAFLLLPAFLSLFHTNKNTISYGPAAAGHNISLTAVLSKFFSLSFDHTQVFEGGPQLYCTIPVFIGFILYFLNKNIEQRERVRYLILFSLLVISFCVHPINLIWHAFSEPEGYLYRYSFLASYIAVECALRCFLKRKGLRIRWIAAAVVIGECILAACCFDNISYLDRSREINNAVSILITGVILTLGVLLQKKLLLRAAAAAFLCLELLANMILVYETASLSGMNYSVYKKQLSTIEPAVQEIKLKDDGFYRIEKNSFFTRNDAFMFDYNGVNIYSSYTPVDQHRFMKKMGFMDEPIYYTYTADNTKLADRILGIKYFISENGIKKLPSSLPVVFTLNRSVDSICAAGNDKTASEDPFEFQQAIMNAYTGRNDDFFADAQIIENRKENDPDNKGRKRITFRLRVQKKGMLYSYINGIKIPEDIIIKNDKNKKVLHFGNASCKKVQAIGEFEKGDEVTVTCSNIVNMPADSDFRFVTEDSARVFAAADLISENEAAVDEVSASRLLIKTKAAADSLVMAVPYNDNWHIKVDSEKVRPREVFGIYMAVPIDDQVSEHTIEMCYIPAGVNEGLVITAVSWIIFAIYILKQRRVMENVRKKM